MQLKPNDLVKLVHTQGMPQALANSGLLGIVVDDSEFPLEHQQLIRKVGTHDAENFVAVHWIKGWGEDPKSYPKDGFFLAARFRLQKKAGEA